MANTASTRVTIKNRLGLHARPATLFVETASRYDSAIHVARTDSDQCVDGKSIMQMMMLAATRGTEIEIKAEGSDSEQAVEELRGLVESQFMEE